MTLSCPYCEKVNSNSLVPNSGQASLVDSGARNRAARACGDSVTFVASQTFPFIPGNGSDRSNLQLIHICMGCASVSVKSFHLWLYGSALAVVVYSGISSARM